MGVLFYSFKGLFGGKEKFGCFFFPDTTVQGEGGLKKYAVFLDYPDSTFSNAFQIGVNANFLCHCYVDYYLVGFVCFFFHYYG